MKKRLSSAAVLLAGLLIISQLASGASIKKKEEAVASIERHKAEIINLSDWIWGFAETALLETRSSKALADYAEEQGFAVERGVAGLPTAFVASYGEGRPIIGVLGEYDALPGLSEKSQPGKEDVQAGPARTAAVRGGLPPQPGPGDPACRASFTGWAFCDSPGRASYSPRTPMIGRPSP